MKKLVIIAATLFLFAFGSLEAKHSHSYGGGINFNYFYGSLSQYGDWIEIDYDLYAWRPSYVSRGWAPYTVGRWIWTNDGWYWDSYEPFGWATFHYGRWHFDEYYGWLWIPGYDWAPSWVEWRYTNDHIGWAPLPPYAHYSRGAGIHFSIDFHYPVHHWNYITINHFHGHNVHHYLVKDRYKHRIHKHTKYRNEYGYRNGNIINRGLDRDFIERRSKRKIDEVRIHNTNTLRETNGRNSGRIERFVPDNRELNRYSNIRNFEVKRSERKSSLNTSQIDSRSRVNSIRENDRKDTRKDKPGVIRNDRDERKYGDRNRNDRGNEVNRDSFKKENKYDRNDDTRRSNNKSIEKKSVNREIRRNSSEINSRKSESSSRTSGATRENREHKRDNSERGSGRR